MTMDKRFVKTYCLQINEQFVPFWELNFFDDEDCGEGYKIDGDYQRYYQDLKECYWDTKEKKIVFGKVKEIKAESKELTVGQSVYVEMEHPNYGFLKEAVIDEIVYEEYDTSIRKLKTLEQYELDWYFTKKEQENLNLEDIYEIRTWKPYYKLDDGEVIRWDYKIKKKFDKNAKKEGK